MAKFTCVFPGRFQPFHTGHMLVLQGMTKLCGRIVVVIGSADKAVSPEEPFTADERRDMIQRALQAKDIIPNFDVEFLMVPDMKDDKEWVKNILESAGEVHQVWSGNEDTKKIFADAGIEVKSIKEVPGMSSTEVRKRMKEGGDWKAIVPEEVASSIGAIDGVQRVKKA